MAGRLECPPSLLPRWGIRRIRIHRVTGNYVLSTIPTLFALLRWPLDAWPGVQTKFVLCTEDRFFPPDFLRRLVAERLHITPDEILAGHYVALSRPKELAQLLIGYAHAGRTNTSA
jgi:hypothetical protein